MFDVILKQNFPVFHDNRDNHEENHMNKTCTVDEVLIFGLL